MTQQTHRSDPAVLNRRTLERDFRRLAEELRPGMSVLDVGCGTGAITAGIARAVGPAGRALGIDRDENLLEIARADHSASNLTFMSGDVESLELRSEFDIACAARTLQWVSNPALAVDHLAGAVKSGGQVIVLDYSHEFSQWEPNPPVEFLGFYAAFLAWRSANGWSNRMGDELPGLFRAAGLEDVRLRHDDEVVERGEPGFRSAAMIWTASIESMGAAMVTAGFLSENERTQALESYNRYAATALQRQSLAMRSASGTRP